MLPGPSLQLYIYSIHRGVYPAPRDHLSNYISYTAFTAEFIPLRGTIRPERLKTELRSPDPETLTKIISISFDNSFL